jgi:hypothetical protein
MVKRWSILSLVALLATLAFGVTGEPAHAQGGIIPLRVEAATTGQLTADAPMVIYSFDALESLRMGIVYDVLEGDMNVTVVVLDQDQSTLLAGSSGPNSEGVIVNFPAEGTYYLGVTGEGGTSATFRLMIDADPALPTNTFVLTTYPVSGTATSCADNVPVASLTATEDLNVCFALELIEDPVDFKSQWWSPSGEVALEETGTLDSSFNSQLLLTGIVYDNSTPWESGWWQVHFLINGELAHIQWVYVQ